MSEKNFSEIFGTDEFEDGSNIGWCVLAEGLGVFFINYFGCLSCINLGDSGPKELVLIGLTFGFVVMVAVQVSRISL